MAPTVSKEHFDHPRPTASEKLTLSADPGTLETVVARRIADILGRRGQLLNAGSGNVGCWDVASIPEST
jgi:hypothetical protein